MRFMKTFNIRCRSILLCLSAAALIAPAVASPAVADQPVVRTQGAVPNRALKLNDLGATSVQSASTFGTTQPEDEDDESMILSSFEPKTIEASDVTSKDGVKIRFDLPAGCGSTGTAGTVDCGFGSATFDPAVVDADGNDVPYRETSQDKSIRLEVTPSSKTVFPLTATMYIGETLTTEDGETATEVASETLGDVIAMGDDLEFTDEELAQEETDLDAALAEEAETTPPTFGPVGPLTPYAKKPGRVTIPKNYRYCPKSCKPKSWHDYCTSSPDQPVVGKYRVDFRGPCARHDMNIQAIMGKKISNSAKKKQWYSANGKLKRQMKQQCQHQFSKGTVFRQNCYITVGVYYAAVTANTFVKKL
ncbi:hypothetical protein F8227_17560 [Brevibacterium linens ATCC 9172]|nr:phospholipase A2 [Brevibacterium sp. S22]KAB1941761.1 hypothetical protein F8227_17560 [Brevibacterium linens ATCC 9172]TGD33312.1 hypothetical protein EB835_02195 [Brevibacterium sp. S22]